MPPLPETSRELQAQRVTTRKRSLNDYVEDIHVGLWDDEEYRAYFKAAWDDESQEGSIAIDRIRACEVIRDTAKEDPINPVGRAKLSNIRAALVEVVRRFKTSTKQRRAAAYIAAGRNPV